MGQLKKMQQGSEKMCADTCRAYDGRLPDVFLFGTTRLIITAGKNDRFAKSKIKGVKAAVRRVQAKGYRLPSVIEVVTVSDDSVQTVAYQRDSLGRQKATIVIGKSVEPERAFNLPPGVATELTPNKKKTSKLVEAITVHEIGHILHELNDGDFFWSEDGDKILVANQVAIAGNISPYAAVNKKEYVAEFFTCYIYGHKKHDTNGNTPALKQYLEFKGPDLQSA